MSNYRCPIAGDLDRYFMTTSRLIDRYAIGTLWGWGLGNSGQLGNNNNSIIAYSSPVQTIAGGQSWKQVACGYRVSSAIKTDGTLWTWGDGFSGSLGNNASNKVSSPIQTIALGNNWKYVAAGSRHFSAIKTDGSLWGWGFNPGALGDNTIVDKSSPVQTMAGGTDWKQVDCGHQYTIAIKTDGTLWGWGSDGYGQLGDNSTTSKSSPVQTVTGGTNWKQVSCGFYHTIGLKTDGTIWGWGEGGHYQIGPTTSSPTQITLDTNWKIISCGGNHSMGIKTDGTLWGWGYDAYGQLGINSNHLDNPAPVQIITGGSNWKDVSCGASHTLAIKTDGTLWCCGANDVGQLCDGTLINRSSPVQTIVFGSSWKQASAGYYNTIATQYSNFTVTPE